MTYFQAAVSKNKKFEGFITSEKVVGLKEELKKKAKKQGLMTYGTIIKATAIAWKRDKGWQMRQRR